MFKYWILAGEVFVTLKMQGLNPARIVSVEPPWKTDKGCSVGLADNWPDFN
jgi:hypothetical protein